MNLEILKQIVTRHEGLLLKPYKDTVGKLTIGVGRNLDDVGISNDEAMCMLGNDLAKALKSAGTFAWFKDLNDNRQIVVVSMIFNMGMGGFLQFKEMIKAIEMKNYKLAACQMLNSLWATQVHARSTELAAMMETD